MSENKNNSDEEWLASQDARVKRLVSENEDLRRQLGMIADYHAKATVPPRWLSTPSKKSGHALACAQLSDTHFDETVNPAEINGLNAYDRQIAEQRLQRWAAKVCEMPRRLDHFKWDGILVPISGDLFSGMIHDELRETNVAYLPDSWSTGHPWWRLPSARSSTPTGRPISIASWATTAASP